VSTPTHHHDPHAKPPITANIAIVYSTMQTFNIGSLLLTEGSETLCGPLDYAGIVRTGLGSSVVMLGLWEWRHLVDPA
jgi:hypothetical protein